MARHDITTGNPATAIPFLREAVAHGYDQGDMNAAVNAIDTNFKAFFDRGGKVRHDPLRYRRGRLPHARCK